MLLTKCIYLKLILTITQVIEGDIQNLIDAARDGDLTQRVDLGDKEGFYKKLSSGINELVDVNERVVNDTVRMFAAMARGDLNHKIETVYRGAFESRQRTGHSVIKMSEMRCIILSHWRHITVLCFRE